MERKITTIKERILQLIEIHNDRKEKFFDEIGVTYANFKEKNKLSSVNSDILVKIITKYPDVNIKWLLTGDGDMLQDCSNCKKVDELLGTIKTMSEKLQLPGIESDAIKVEKKTSHIG